MSPTETQAILTVSLLAAFADGRKHERERDEIRRIAEGLVQSDAVHMPSLVQDVLLRRVTLQTTLPQLQSEAARQLAYEMAVCVCDADGTQSDGERRFLADLARQLGLDDASASEFSAQAEALAGAALPPSRPVATAAAAPGMATVTATSLPSVVPAALGAAAGVTAGVAAGAVAAPAAAPAAARPDAELDREILNAAILNGALELLPESLSTMAIIPLQMRLVYRIGQRYGYSLDSGHIKDFLATLGVGLTSQYLESAGRKLLGGLLGRRGGSLAGGLLRAVAQQSVSSGMSFVSTYALGHVAKSYYAGGRTFSTQMLKDAYASMTSEAQSLQARYRPEIEAKARTLDAGQVLAMVRGR